MRKKGYTSGGQLVRQRRWVKTVTLLRWYQWKQQGHLNKWVSQHGRIRGKGRNILTCLRRVTIRNHEVLQLYEVPLSPQYIVI